MSRKLRKINLYYAAPLFTEAERQWNANNVRLIRRWEEEFLETLYVPQEFCAGLDANPIGIDKKQIFKTCMDNLNKVDGVIAVLDGSDVDSGTAWEVGYAIAKGISVVGLRTDWRPGEARLSTSTATGANAMIINSCTRVCSSLEEIYKHLYEHCAVALSIPKVIKPRKKK